MKIYPSLFLHVSPPFLSLSPLVNHPSPSSYLHLSHSGRTRFLLELVKEVREVWPTEKPLFVRLISHSLLPLPLSSLSSSHGRISASDWVNDEPSWTIQDSCELSYFSFLCFHSVSFLASFFHCRHLLEKAGVDVVDCSSGGNSPKQVIDNVPG